MMKVDRIDVLYDNTDEFQSDINTRQKDGFDYESVAQYRNGTVKVIWKRVK